MGLKKTHTFSSACEPSTRCLIWHGVVMEGNRKMTGCPGLLVTTVHQ